MEDKDLVKDGEIHEMESGFWYAMIEFGSDVTEDCLKLAKLSLLNRLNGFLLENSSGAFFIKFKMEARIKHDRDPLGRSKMKPPYVTLSICNEEQARHWCL